MMWWVIRIMSFIFYFYYASVFLVVPSWRFSFWSYILLKLCIWCIVLYVIFLFIYLARLTVLSWSVMFPFFRLKREVCSTDRDSTIATLGVHTCMLDLHTGMNHNSQVVLAPAWVCSQGASDWLILKRRDADLWPRRYVSSIYST